MRTAQDPTMAQKRTLGTIVDANAMARVGGGFGISGTVELLEPLSDELAERIRRREIGDVDGRLAELSVWDVTPGTKKITVDLPDIPDYHPRFFDEANRQAAALVGRPFTVPG